MATNRDFQSMLNEYLPLELLRAEAMKRDYVLQNAEIDDGWKGGNLVVPFEGQHATSVEFGQLADQADVSKFKYVRGSISTQPEVWGTMRFEHRDLLEHDGKIPEKTFLRILPGQIDDFLLCENGSECKHARRPPFRDFDSRRNGTWCNGS